MKRTVLLALMIFLLCLGMTMTFAEETKHGKFIYVPSSNSVPEGNYSLRAEYKPVTEEGEQTEPCNLAGAVFGVYVVSVDGEPIPWANPLYLWEQMKLQTGEEPVHFSLPKGIDFYLRQESAPEGILFDSAKLIPINDTDIIVCNETYGELVISAHDSLGEALPGVSFTIMDQENNIHNLVADENGSAVYHVTQAETFQVSESGIPVGVYEAMRVQIEDKVSQSTSTSVLAAPSERIRVDFIHPTAGLVRVQWFVSGPDENGVIQREPLAGVEINLGEDGTQLLTNENGEAEVAMLEGRYAVSFRYPGEDAILSVEHGEMIVSSGSTTLIELTADRPDGRVRIHTDKDTLESGSYLLRNADTGEEFGPYSLNDPGVSEPLRPGLYEIALQMPPECILEGWRQGDNEQRGKPENISILAGGLADIELIVRKLEQKSLFVTAIRISDDGQIEEKILSDSLTLTICDSDGNNRQTVLAENGVVNLTAMDGVYTARMTEEAADEKGLLELSEPFRFSEMSEDGIIFRQEDARLILQSEDLYGTPLAGGVYRVLGTGGTEQTVICDASGRGVSAPLPAGQVVIETISSPDGYDDAGAIKVTVEAGIASEIPLTHPALGVAAFVVHVQSLDARANPLMTPLSEVEIQVTAVEDSPLASFVTLHTDANGEASIRLKPGDYSARIAEIKNTDIRAGDSVVFHVENGASETVQLSAYMPLGGVLLHLTDGDTSDVDETGFRFSLVASNGEHIALQPSQNGFFATGLAEGEYQLNAEEAPEGSPTIRERTITIKGGERTEIVVSLSEVAILSVSKIGLTFNRDMKTFAVPLSGEYMVYTMEGEKLIPFPSGDEQLSVWANVNTTDKDRHSEIHLPAAQEGTKYYLREKEASVGFTADEEIHEIELHAGERARPVFAVASDRGFFTMSVQDAETGESLAGGEYCLFDADGRDVLSFTVRESGYESETALPVGVYTLRQLSAPEGYALSEQTEMQVQITSWLYGFDSESVISISCTQIPTDAVLKTDLTLWQSSDGEQQYIGMDAGKTPKGIRLYKPTLILNPSSEQAKRLNIRAVTISGTGYSVGSLYRARIEYALRNGGWQPSSAVLTEPLTTLQTISLENVPEDVEAVSLTFLRSDSGKEIAEAGFTPGQIVLTLIAEDDDETPVLMNAEMSGVYLYRTIPEKAQAISLSRSVEGQFAIAGSGNFGTESGGRDGSVSGVAFLDTNSNGLLEQQESGRYAGLTVRLLDASGENVDATRTDSDGKYAFQNIPTGMYCLQFSVGDRLVYSSGSLFSDHVISHVENGQEGRTSFFSIDADHTDYVRNAGCVYAATLEGNVFALQADEEEIGMGGIGITLLRSGDMDTDAKVAITEDDGSFAFTGLYPGEYQITVTIPSGYIMVNGSEDLENKIIRLSQGEIANIDDIRIIRSATVEGMLWFDKDGDGLLSDPVRPLPDVFIRLISVQKDSTIPLQEAVTDETGSFHFEGILPGEYVLQAELEDGYAFTSCTDQSRIYGAAGRIGTTPSFTLKVGEQLEDVFIGATRPGKIEVRVFADERADGIWGPYDTGLADVGLQLIRMEVGQEAGVLSAITNSEGVAVFENISPGIYVISYEMPGLWRATQRPKRVTAGAVFSEVPRSSNRMGKSDVLALSAGESRTFVIGAAITGCITGTAFLDINANGVKDGNEHGIADIGADLLDSSGKVIASTVTMEDGTYRFEGLAAERYTVRFRAPQEFGFSGSERTAQAGSAESTTDSVSETRAITVVAGKTFERADAALVRLATVSGRIWVDADADGKPNAEEEYMAGVSVDLMNAAGRIVLRSLNTDAEGKYTFDRLMPGSYLIRILLPDGYVFTVSESGTFNISNLRGKYGYSSTFLVADGQVIQNADIGILMECSVSGMVWQDDNYDGIIDSAESGLRGATVTLLDASGNELLSVRTDRKGTYLFDKLKPGIYSIEIQLPDSYVFTVDGGDSVVARSDLSFGTVQIGTLVMGQKLNNFNIGTLLPASISGTIWFDADDDGRMRVGETGMPDIVVKLRMTNGKDTGREIITKTDEKGGYQLEGVMPGIAILSYSIPDNYAFSNNAVGRSRVSTVPMTDATEADSEPLQITAGSIVSDRDVGIVSVGIVEGHLRETESDYGKQDDRGVAGATVQLLDSVDRKVLSQTETDENGAYAFSFVRKGQYLLRMELPDGLIFADGEKTVFAKTDDSIQNSDVFTLSMGEGKSDSNAYCIRTALLTGEIHLSGTDEGIPGAVVSLLSGGTIIRSSETDALGKYSFGKLRPGNYRIRYSMPANALFSVNTMLNMKDMDAVEAETDNLCLEAGQILEAESVYAVWGASIHGTAWLDRNADGRMDAKEDRLSDVLVFLLNDKNEAISSARTGDDGQYSFVRLREGNYRLFFSLPDGMLFADRRSELGSSIITPTENSEGLSEPLSLNMGGILKEINVGAIQPGEIGDTVWLDENGNGLQDYREPLLSGVTLRLTRESEFGEKLDTYEIKSDEYGYFWFRSLRPGKYRLQAEIGQNGILTVHLGAPLTEIDSDLHPETAESDVILLESGQTLRNVDVGFLRY